MIEGALTFDGYAFWRSPERVKPVIAALASAPPSSKPSYFTNATSRALTSACTPSSSVAVNGPANFTIDAVADSMQNW